MMKKILKNLKSKKHSSQTKFVIRKIIVFLLFMFISIGVIYANLYIMQTLLTEYSQYVETDTTLNKVVKTIKTNEKNIDNLSSFFYETNEQLIEDVYQCGMENVVTSSIPEKFQNIFDDVATPNLINVLYLIDDKGNVYASNLKMNGFDVIGENLFESELLSRNDVKRLLEKKELTYIRLRNDDNNIFFYSKYVADGYYLVLETDDLVLKYQTETLTDVSEVLSETKIGENGFLFAINPTTKKFLFYENNQDVFTNKKIQSVGLTDDILTNDYFGLQFIHNDLYICETRAYSDNMVICTAIPAIDIVRSNSEMIYLILIVYIIIVILLILYSASIKDAIYNNQIKSKKKKFSFFKWTRYYDIEVAKRVLSFAVIAAVFMYFVSLYTFTLVSTERVIHESETITKTIEDKLSNKSTDAEILYDYYEQQYKIKCKYISCILENNPSFLNEYSAKHHMYYDEKNNRIFISDNEGNRLKSIPNSQYLKDMCEKNGIVSMYVVDDYGRTIATSADDWYFTISYDKEDPTYELLNVLDGKQDLLIQHMKKGQSKTFSQYVAVSFKYYTTLDENGNTKYVSKYEYEKDPVHVQDHSSLIRMEMNSAALDYSLYSNESESTFDSTVIPYGGNLIIFDNDEKHTIEYAPHKVLVGMEGSEIGFQDSSFSGNYTGFKKIDGKDYISTVRELDDKFITINLPSSEIYSGRFTLCLVNSIIIFLFLIIFSLNLVLKKEEKETYLHQIIEKSKKKVSSNGSFLLKWNTFKNLHKKTPEQKLMVSIKVISFAYTIYLFIVLSNVGGNWDSSIEKYILSESWDHNFNIFSLSNCALILLTAFIWVSIVNGYIHFVSKTLSTKSETLAHLLMSVIKYGVSLFVLFYCLYVIGFDSRSLLTSAGILSLVIGLGAQSMIADILAGVFMVFEGTFQVGDVVMIDGKRGRVLDIGLRTTKIKNDENNIAVFNNSRIANLINMTRELSIITTTIKIKAGISLFKVEEILNMELPYIKSIIPLIQVGPVYKGIENIQDESLILVLQTYCMEKDIIKVQRNLNRMIYLVLRQHRLISSDEGDVVVSKKES